MKSRAAVLFDAPGEWEIIEVEVDEPEGVRGPRSLSSTPACATPTTTTPRATCRRWPTRSAGATRAPASSRRSARASATSQVGDHVVAAFIPGCGRCTWCARGMQNLCDNGAYMMLGTQLDGTFRLHTEDGTDVGQCSLVSTFSEYSVLPEWGAIKIDKDIPLSVAALVGCGVPDRLGLRRQRGPGPPRRRRHRHGRRRHRHQRCPGRQVRRRLAHHRRRPGAVPSRDGAQARRDRRASRTWPRPPTWPSR